MHPLEQKVLSCIRRENLINSGDSVLVALSGGADSVALLHMLKLYSTELRFTLYAMHVHHGLRGEFADRDEAFVRALCKELSVELFVNHVDVNAEVLRTKESVEEAGRRLRYECFDKEIPRLVNGKIATAHSASDQAETVLLRVMRGCGVNGVTGIPVKRGCIIRPLLQCYSDEIRDYCHDMGYEYVVDETNDQLCYTRNRVRHRILRDMREVNPKIEQSLVRFSTLAAMDNRFLDSCAESLLDTARLSENVYCVQTLMQADEAIRYRAIAKMTAHAEYFHIQSLCEVLECGGCVNFPHDIVAASDGKTLTWMLCERCKPSPRSHECFSVEIGVPFVFGDAIYCATYMSYNEYAKALQEDTRLSTWCVSVEDEAVLTVRSRESGDSVSPYGRGCTKTVKKLLNEYRIPVEKREDIPVVLCNNRVAALLGVCVDQTAYVTKGAMKIVCFRKTETLQKII